LTIPMASLLTVVSTVLVLSCGQRDRQTHQKHTQRDAAERLTSATVVSIEPSSLKMQRLYRSQIADKT